MSTSPSGRRSAARAARESAAAARAAEQARRQRERRVRLTAIIVVAVLVVVGGVVAWATSQPDAQAATPAGVNAPGGPIVLGATGADAAQVPVVDVWEDFQCPYCQQFEQANGQLLVDYAQREQLTVRYHLASFLGPESQRAANAAGCAADEGQFPAYHAALYENQPPEGTGGYTVDQLLEIGQSVGLTSEEFAQCVQEDRYGEWVRAMQHEFDAAGLRGTPSILLDGTLLGPEEITAEAFPARLEQAINGG